MFRSASKYKLLPSKHMMSEKTIISSNRNPLNTSMLSRLLHAQDFCFSRAGVLLKLEILSGASCPTAAHAYVEEFALLLHDERDRHRQPKPHRVAPVDSGDG